MGYQSDYARTVADIYGQLGQGQAQARLQQGSAWANAFGQIGQTVAAIPGQMQDQKNAEAQRLRMDADDKRQARQDEIQEWTFDQARNKAHDQSVLARVASSSMVDGKYDFTKMMELGQQEGVPMESLTEAIGRLRQFQASDVQLQTYLMQGKITQMQYEEALLENFSKEAILAGFHPEAMGLIFQTSKDKGMNIAPWKQAWETDPKALAAELKKRYGGPPPPTREIKTRNADGSETIQIVADTPGQTFPSAAEPIDVGSFQYYVTQLYGTRPTPEQIASARRSYGEAGRAPTVNVNMGPEPVAPPSDVSSQDIMSQAGLSRMGYLSLTNPTSIPRDQATRTRAAEEVAAWARARGIDTSTFEAKFKAYNKVMSNNIMRLNTVQNIELDLQGTIQNLQNAATEAGMTDVTAVNAMKLWLAGNLNDPRAINYATNLEALVSDIARYNSSSSSPDGDRNPLDADMTAARNLLKRGISSGGLAGVLKAVNASVATMDRVNKTAVTRAEKAVWTLFGVGDKYQPKVDAPGAGGGVQEGTEQAIPGITGGVAKFTNGKWIRVK